VNVTYVTDFRLVAQFLCAARKTVTRICNIRPGAF
jgi:hypothetical protein